MKLALMHSRFALHSLWLFLRGFSISFDYVVLYFAVSVWLNSILIWNPDDYEVMEVVFQKDCSRERSYSTFQRTKSHEQERTETTYAFSYDDYPNFPTKVARKLKRWKPAPFSSLFYDRIQSRILIRPKFSFNQKSPTRPWAGDKPPFTFLLSHHHVSTFAEER